MWGNWWGMVASKKGVESLWFFFFLSFSFFFFLVTGPPPLPRHQPLPKLSVKPLHPTTVQAWSHTSHQGFSHSDLYRWHCHTDTESSSEKGVETAGSRYVSGDLKSWTLCERLPRKSFGGESQGVSDSGCTVVLPTRLDLGAVWKVALGTRTKLCCLVLYLPGGDAFLPNYMNCICKTRRPQPSLFSVLQCAGIMLDMLLFGLCFIFSTKSHNPKVFIYYFFFKSMLCLCCVDSSSFDTCCMTWQHDHRNNARHKKTAINLFTMCFLTTRWY